MNTITVNKKMGCGTTLHIHYNHVDYVSISTGHNGECKHAVWYIISEFSKINKREDVIKILRGVGCESGVAGCKSCFDFVAKLLEAECEKK